jgi:hypothetical protein
MATNNMISVDQKYELNKGLFDTPGTLPISLQSKYPLSAPYLWISDLSCRIMSYVMI